MDATKIIVWTNPTAPFQKIYVFKDGNLVDQMGITPNYIVNVVLELVEKYQINNIDFSGSKSFGEHFVESLRNEAITNYKLLQHFTDGQQKYCAAQLVRGVDHSDGEGRSRLVKDRRCEHNFGNPEQCQPEHRTGNVEKQMEQCCTASVAVGAGRGQHSRHAGTDILSHDNGHSSTQGHSAGHGQGLQNTHRRRGGLDDCRQQCADKDAQNGIGESDEQLLEGRHILEAADSAAHSIHAEHQCGKAQQDHAGVLLLVVLTEHKEGNADERQDGGETGGLQQLHKKIITGNATQRQDPARHRCTNVGADDDIDGLPQGHKAGVDETDHHNRGCRRGLDHGSHSKAGDKTSKLAGSQLTEQSFQSAACPALQSLTHDVHAKQEQAQAANKIEYVEYIHNKIPPILLLLLTKQA